MNTKESKYEEQKINCNCNDCIYLERDFIALEESKKRNRSYYAWSYKYRRCNKLKRAKKALEGTETNQKRHDALLEERSNLSLDTSFRSGLSFGKCRKLEKDITFIPNLLQIETQGCFKHRLDELTEEERIERFNK